MDVPLARVQDHAHMLSELLSAWCLWMRAASRSTRTIDARRDLILQFARQSPTDILTCDWEEIAAFLLNERFCQSTRAQYQTMLRQWYRWLVARGVRSDNPVDELGKIRMARRLPRPVSTDQLGLALTSGRYYSRTRTMILLGAFQGLRVSEIAKVRGEHLRGGQFRVIGKGNKERLIPIHALIEAEAHCYPRIGPWFPSPADRSQPITGKNVSNVLGKALRRSGVDATGHQLRHWYGTQSLRSAGGNIRVVQELLGHASLASTAIYTLVDDDQMRAAVNGLPVPLHLA